MRNLTELSLLFAIMEPALTCAKEQREVMENYQPGVNSHIVKPVRFERFVETVQNLGMHWPLLNQPPDFNE